MDKKLMEYMGNPEVFVSDVEPETVKDAVIVNEEIVLSSDEVEVLRLGPKFCLLTWMMRILTLIWKRLL